MKCIAITLVFLLSAGFAEASWWWPFGASDSAAEARPPRISELMEPVGLLLDEASDFSNQGKVQEAVGKYREALQALDGIERDNPERAETPEFATVRNKRAYVNAAIDSLLLTQAKENAKSVAVSDTTALEARLAAEKNGAKPSAAATLTPAKARESALKPRVETPPKKVPRTRREQVLADVAAGDYAAAELVLAEMLNEKPKDVAALNLKAMVQVEKGDLAAAEATLDEAIASNPRSYHAYYNMARLYLRKDPPNRVGARKYYETGRAYGGMRDEALEVKTK